MAKKIEIDIEVKSQSVVDAKDNVDGLNKSIKDTETTTQDFGKSVKIEYDKAGNATDVLVDKSLSLTKQQRAIKAQMEILTATGKAQSKEFTILQRKYNDIGDSLSQNKARSQELFGTLSMLPGPVGDFAQSLQGGLDLLKTFSGVRLTDLKNQFKGVSDDLKEIFRGFSEFNKKPIQTPPTPSAPSGGGTATPTVATTGNVESINASLEKRVQVLKEVNLAQNKANYSGQVFDATTGNIVNQQENLTKASTGAKGAIQSQKVATDALTASEVSATVGATLLKAALAALGIGLIITAIIGAVTALKDFSYWIIRDKLGFEEFGRAEEFATKQVENFNDAIKRQNELLQESIAQIDFETKKAELKAKIAKKSEDEIFNITKQGLIDRKNLITRDLNDALATQKKLAGEDVDKLSQEQAGRRFKQLELNADNIKKLTQDESRAREAIELASLNRSLFQQQDYYSKSLAELDAKIQLEIDKDKTGGERLQQLIDERAKKVIEHEHLFGKAAEAQRELMRKNGLKKTQEALDEDTKRVQAYQSRIGDIYNAAILDNQLRDETARKKKLNDDINAIKLDTEFRKKGIIEQQVILKELELGYENDLVKIKEGYFLKKFNINEQNFDLEQSQLTQNILNKKAKQDEEILDDKNYYQLLHWNLKDYYAAKAVDVQKAFEDEFLLKNENYQNELIALKTAYDEKKLTDDGYAEAVRLVNEKISANNQDFFNKERQLAQLKLDLRKKDAAVEFQIADNLVAMLNQLGQTSKEFQVAAALVEAGVGIAKIIISTQTAIAEYAPMSLLAFGPIAGPIAATAYAIKQKIQAAIGIATITVGAIQKLNSIKGQSAGSASSSGSKSMGKNYGDGGMIDGPRHAGGGVMINAEGGEAVMTRGAVTMFQPLLSMLNQAGGGTSFSKGAVGQASFDNPQSQIGQMEQPIIKTFVVESELTTIQHRTARLKDLSTL